MRYLLDTSAGGGGLILVTANTQEFVGVQGLHCEDWSISGEGST